MTLSRWRRVATGIAAGVIVLSAALIGASFRDDNGGVSVASDLRPANVIPIEDDPGDTSTDDATDSVQVIEVDALPDDAAADDSSDSATDDPPTGDAAESAPADVSPDEVEDATASPADDATASPDDDASTDSASGTDSAPDPAETDDAADTTTAAPAEPAAPAGETLGTGGGVDNTECALDRLVIYAGARRGGVAGSIRNALAQAGFGAGCTAPVTVLASNCPLQFAGALGAGSGYDPNKSYVASSANVDRATLAAVIGTVGYSGNEIDILDFGFVNPDRPGEQWIAIFVPPSFSGWENLAARAGLSPTSSSLCAASGELAG